MKKKNKLNVNKASLVEATMLAMTGKLVLEEEKEVITEDVEIETSDVEVVVGENETIIESDEATIIVQEAETESSEEEEETPETVEIPVEGDETIIPEEVIEEPVEEIPSIDEIVDEEPIITDEPAEEVSVEATEDIEEEEEVVEESVSLEEELTEETFPNEGTYWNGDGRYQKDVELLNKLIPDQGTEPAIKDVLPDNVVAEYITLSNKYYRWFNDGDVPFRKLADGTVIYPSYTRGDKAKTGLGQKTTNSISFDLEKRVNALIEKINDEYPDWREKIGSTEEVVVEEVTESLEESKEVVEEDYSQKLGGEPADFISDLQVILRELKTIEIDNFGTNLAKEMVMEFERTVENQIEMTKSKYELEEEKEIKEEAIMDDYDFKQFLAYEIKNKRPEITEKFGFESPEYEAIVEGLYNKVDSQVDYILENAINEIDIEEVKVEEESVDIVEESKETEKVVEEEVIEESKEKVEEDIAPKNKFSADSFQQIVEGFYKETYKTFESFKLNRVLKNESNIRIYGQLTNNLGSVKNICLEGKILQSGKTFTKYAMNESTGTKLESKESTRLSMMTFTNKDNVLECKYLRHTAKKLEK